MTKLAAFAALLLLSAAPPAPAAPGGTATVDPPRDMAHPARNQQVLVPSHGEQMNGLLFLAAGAGPKPTLLLMHGLPGNERNLDLAQAVRRAGWHVLTFTYRGAWGSPGDFSIAHAVEDAGAALAWLRDPKVAAAHGIDTSRIVIGGHSMGAFAAALQAAKEASAPPVPSKAEGRSPPLTGLILLDAGNIGATGAEERAKGPAARAAFVAGFDDLGHALQGATAETLADETLASGPAWDLTTHAPALARLPVLTIYATHGIAADNKALAAAIRGAGGERLVEKELNSDHGFADSRIALAEAVVTYLASVQ